MSDGRGAMLPKELYDDIGPTRVYILDDRFADHKKLPDISVDGVVKRVFMLSDESNDVHFCNNC